MGARWVQTLPLLLLMIASLEQRGVPAYFHQNNELNGINMFKGALISFLVLSLRCTSNYSDRATQSLHHDQ